MNLLKSLLIKADKNLSEFIILKILITLRDLDFRCKEINNLKILEELFDYLNNFQIEKSLKEKDEEITEQEILNKENFEKIMDIFSLTFKNQINLLSDDTFKVNLFKGKNKQILFIFLIY